MLDALTLLWIAVAPAALAALGYRLGKRHQKADTLWHRVRVSRQGRGPNADEFYWVPPAHDHGTGPRPVWFTDEQVVAAKIRASSLSHQPHSHD